MFPGGGGSRKQHARSAGFLARPRLGVVRGVYSAKPLSTRAPNYLTSGSFADRAKKMKYRKTATGPSKMDQYKRRPDPVDTAYREAVGRLKILLAESYTVPIVGKRPLRDDSGDDTDNQSLVSSRSRHSHHHYHRSSPFISRRYPYYGNTVPKYEKSHVHTDYKTVAPEPERKDLSPEKWEDKQQTPEMMSFIERQEEYIEQLEREAQFCREELSGLLGKVKEVISENENLHERQKSNLIKSVFDHLETETETEIELEVTKSPKKSPKRSRRLEGPSIVFESRISELEAQLTQTKIELRKCQDENENYKRKIADGTIGDLSAFDTYKIQIENLQREKGNLQDQISKLQYELAQLRDRNNDTTHKIKRSLDVVEQAQFEKTQLEAEIRRLKDELDRQHDKLRETIHEQTRRITDERAAVERRYSQQIEQLTTELGVQWETASKLQLELDKQRREDSDFKREIAQKQAHIDELKKEIQAKTATLQSDLATSSAEKGALEQQISNLHLAVERAERQAKQESNRFQAEVQSFRQRLDRADADLLHSRRENLRLTEQVASLEKELNMNALLAEEKSKKPSTSSEIQPMVALPLPSPKPDREKELTSMIKDMEAKHVATVAELEGMIQSQNQLMEKLTGECHLLTQKLEDASNRHKNEIRELQANLNFLTKSIKHPQSNVVQSSPKDEQHFMEKTQRASPYYTEPARQHYKPIASGSPHDTPVNKDSRNRINTFASSRNTPPSSTSSPAKHKVFLKQPEANKRRPSIIPTNIREETEPANGLQINEYKNDQQQTPDKTITNKSVNQQKVKPEEITNKADKVDSVNYQEQNIINAHSKTAPYEQPDRKNKPVSRQNSKEYLTSEQVIKKEKVPTYQENTNVNKPQFSRKSSIAKEETTPVAQESSISTLNKQRPIEETQQFENTAPSNIVEPIEQTHYVNQSKLPDQQLETEQYAINQPQHAQQIVDESYQDSQSYSNEQQFSDQLYPDEQFRTDHPHNDEQQYVDDQQYATDQPYPSDQHYPSDQYSTEQYVTDQQYPDNQQYDPGYTIDQEYTAEQMYTGDQQYVNDPQYTMDQEYVGDQQYSTDQYMDDQQYPIEQQYTSEEYMDKQYEQQQNYPTKQEYLPQKQEIADDNEKVNYNSTEDIQKEKTTEELKRSSEPKQ